MARRDKRARIAKARARQSSTAGAAAHGRDPHRGIQWYALPAAIALGLIVYVGVGVHNEWKYCRESPVLLEAYGFYTVALNNALERHDPYESAISAERSCIRRWRWW